MDFVVSLKLRHLVFFFLLLLFCGCAQQTLKKENSNIQVKQSPSEFYLSLKRISPPKVIYCIKPELIGEFIVVDDSLDVEKSMWAYSSLSDIFLHRGDSLTVSLEDSVFYYFFKKTHLSDSTNKIAMFRYLKINFVNVPLPKFVIRWVNSTKLNIRSKPSKNSSIKDTLFLYDSVFVVDEYKGWSKILLHENMNWADSSAYGWVYSKYLSKTKSEAEEVYNRKQRLKKIALYKKKGWSKKVINAILSHKIFIGMTAKQVIESWGPPDRVNRSVFKWEVHEQWIYERGSVFDATYLYFENDTLTGWQDSY